MTKNIFDKNIWENCNNDNKNGPPQIVDSQQSRIFMGLGFK
jgi:hypothetical protein